MFSRDLITLETPSTEAQVDRVPNNRYDATWERSILRILNRVSVNSSCEQNSVNGPLLQRAACAVEEINGS